MFTMHLLLYCTLFLLPVALCDDNCKKPDELKEKEDYCWSTEVEIVERVVQTSRNLLNFAKKKLGITVEDENGPQKCEYYMCILRQLQLLNAHDYPAYDNIKIWAEKHVIYAQAIEFTKQLDKCHQALTNSSVQQLPFNADQVDNEKSQQNDMIATVESTTDIEQTTCEISAEYIDCLSRQKECPVFQYP